MRIGINLLYLIPGQCGGTETYGVCLVNALADLDQKNEYVVFLNRESKDLALSEADNLEKVICNVRAVHRSLRYLYEQLVLPFLLIRKRIDLVHSLGYVAPLVVPCITWSLFPTELCRRAPKHSLVQAPDTRFFFIISCSPH